MGDARGPHVAHLEREAEAGASRPCLSTSPPERPSTRTGRPPRGGSLRCSSVGDQKIQKALPNHPLVRARSALGRRRASLLLLLAPGLRLAPCSRGLMSRNTQNQETRRQPDVHVFSAGVWPSHPSTTHPKHKSQLLAKPHPYFARLVVLRRSMPSVPRETHR